MHIDNSNGLICIYAEGTNKITNSEKSFFSDFIYLGKNDSVDNYVEVPRDIWKYYIDEGKIEYAEVIHERLQDVEKENVDLLSTTFLLDFRVFDLEYAISEMTGISTMALNIENREGRSTMALTPYEMAKKLILLGEYDRTQMEFMLGKYLSRGAITKEQYDELIALMDNNELIASTNNAAK